MKKLKKPDANKAMKYEIFIDRNKTDVHALKATITCGGIASISAELDDDELWRKNEDGDADVTFVILSL